MSPFAADDRRTITVYEKEYASSVEIKTVIADRTVRNVLLNSTCDLIDCKFGDDLLKSYIPYEHAVQVAQKMAVLNINFCIYVKATKCSLAYRVLSQHYSI